MNQKTTSTTLSSALKLVDGCDIGQIASVQQPTVKMFEPILVNPNSYKNVLSLDVMVHHIVMQEE